MRTLGPDLLLHLWPNLLGVFYPMPLGGRIASEGECDVASIGGGREGDGGELGGVVIFLYRKNINFEDYHQTQ